MQRVRRRKLYIVSVLFVLLLTSVPAAGAKQYEIGAYDVALRLTEEGHFVITERITYDFIEGTFTGANREVPGRGFRRLRFVSVEGVDVPVESVTYKDGSRLAVDWTFPETAGSATFVLTYEGEGGLQSDDGFNVIDWNPVGSGWTVPVRNVSVTVELPYEVDAAAVEASPREDVVGGPSSRTVSFFKESVPPGTFYHVVLRFPEIWPWEPPAPVAPWVLAGLAVGLLLAVGDVLLYYNNRPRPASSGLAPETLSGLELGGILFRTNAEGRRGIAAEVFRLARDGHVRLVVVPKRHAFGTDEVRVEVGEASGLDAAEARLVEQLRRRGTLRRFARDLAGIRAVLKLTEAQLERKGLYSPHRRRQSAWTTVAALVYAVAAGGAFAYYDYSGAPAVLALAVVFLIQFVGKLVRLASISPLTPEGLFVKREAEKLLSEKLRRVDDLMRYETERAWDVLFEELHWLALHRSVTGSKLAKWQRQFRRLEHVGTPAWFALDPERAGDRAGRALDDLTAVQLVNYAFIAVMATSGSTGSSGGSGVPGTGAPGAGIGGGGGGAR